MHKRTKTTTTTTTTATTTTTTSTTTTTTTTTTTKLMNVHALWDSLNVGIRSGMQACGLLFFVFFLCYVGLTCTSFTHLWIAPPVVRVRLIG